MALPPGAKLGRYEILSQLGVGGMGEVYLATDIKLDRRVALKILPAELALSRERMLRFVQEAKAAAALNHPNVAHVYEIGEHDGVNFIAMEFVEGRPCARRSTTRRPISGSSSNTCNRSPPDLPKRTLRELSTAI